jgi:negative regulator of flagellin synthesis FlgM
MIMQVSNNGITSNTNTSGKQTVVEPTTEGPTRDSAAPASKDSVELSHEAQALKKLETHIMASSDVDQRRVDNIRQAISDGSYAINDESIAEKMMESSDIHGHS